MTVSNRTPVPSWSLRRTKSQAHTWSFHAGRRRTHEPSSDHRCPLFGPDYGPFLDSLGETDLVELLQGLAGGCFILEDNPEEAALAPREGGEMAARGGGQRDRDAGRVADRCGHGGGLVDGGGWRLGRSEGCLKRPWVDPGMSIGAEQLNCFCNDKAISGVRVSPFGCLRTYALPQRPAAFRSGTHPSSAFGARASSVCPS